MLCSGTYLLSTQTCQRDNSRNSWRSKAQDWNIRSVMFWSRQWGQKLCEPAQTMLVSNGWAFLFFPSFLNVLYIGTNTTHWWGCLSRKLVLLIACIRISNTAAMCWGNGNCSRTWGWDVLGHCAPCSMVLFYCSFLQLSPVLSRSGKCLVNLCEFLCTMLFIVL